MSYLVFGTGVAPRFRTEFQTLKLGEASRQRWDAVMVPGQSFPIETIEAFEQLSAANFGVRVQHVLNDLSFREGFLRVNRHLRPDGVIFNNMHWLDGDYEDFRARKFAHLIGAVDIDNFCPAAKENNRTPEKWSIGIQSKGRSLAIVLDAISKIEAPVQLTAFRASPDDFELYREEISSGKLCLQGAVDDSQLAQFYRTCDLVVHCEQHAGWANIVAEAMACGVPVVCTRAGTLTIADHLETAFVVEHASSEEIAQGILALMQDAELRKRVVHNARARVVQYGWADYAAALLAICRDAARLNDAVS